MATTPIQKAMSTQRLFVSRLSIRTKKHHLMQLFAEHGVTHAVMVRKKSGNLAFLTFATPEGAAAALAMARKNSLSCHNRRIRVSPADSWHSRQLTRENSKPLAIANSQPLVENGMNNYYSGIPALPRECVTRIAEFLPYAERARMEQVSRLWRAATIDSYRSVTRLDTATWQGKITNEQLYWAINRCGPNLKSLRLHNGDSSEHIQSQLVSIAAKRCRKLQSIDLLGVVVRPSALREIADNIHGLRCFNLGVCRGPTDQQLSRIFESNPNLERIGLVNSSLGGKALRHLSKNLSHLTIMGCPNVMEHHIVYAIQRFTELQSFELNQCNMATYDNIVMALTENRRLGETMTSLKISACPWLLKDIDNEIMFDGINIFEVTANLPAIYRNLKQLQVSYCSWVNNTFIENVGRYMRNLEFLDITGCSNIRGEFSLDPLSNLRSCTTLLMSHLHEEVRGDFLKNLTALTTLDCRDNLGITNQDVGHLLLNAHSLGIVSLEGCYQITTVIAQYAWLLTQIKRNSLIRLHLFLGNTMARGYKELASNEFLSIHYNNYA